jgi:hypothetical protein
MVFCASKDALSKYNNTVLLLCDRATSIEKSAKYAYQQCNLPSVPLMVRRKRTSPLPTSGKRSMAFSCVLPVGANSECGTQYSRYLGRPANEEHVINSTIVGAHQHATSAKGGIKGVVTLLKEEHVNSTHRTLSSDGNCRAPHIHRRSPKGVVRSC